MDYEEQYKVAEKATKEAMANETLRELVIRLRTPGAKITVGPGSDLDRLLFGALDAANRLATTEARLREVERDRQEMEQDIERERDEMERLSQDTAKRFEDMKAYAEHLELKLAAAERERDEVREAAARWHADADRRAGRLIEVEAVARELLERGHSIECERHRVLGDPTVGVNITTGEYMRPPTPWTCFCGFDHARALLGEGKSPLASVPCCYCDGPETCAEYNTTGRCREVGEGKE